MEWLTPLTGAYAASAAVPLLLALYFLKLKRREMQVSSTLLWKRAVQDLQVNAPFQRLRRNLLLLLQLLALAAILFALAGPVLALRRGPGRRYVLLIDRSASMNATDVESSRLDEARRQAKVFVDSMRSGSALSLRSESDVAMVIAFDKRAKVMCNFTADKRQLAAALEAIEPSDGVSRLAEAVTAARAFAETAGTDSRAQLVLFSDGRIEDLDAVALADDELVFHRIGASQENVAITAMKARRSYERPEEVDVFASLANYGPEGIACDVQLAVDGDVRAVRSVAVPRSQLDSDDGRPRPGQAAVHFSLSHRDEGVLEVRQLQADALASDDTAWSVLEPPRRLSVLLVTEGNPVLESALRACPISRLDPCTPAGFDDMDPAAFLVRPAYDVIVLDNHVPAHLPRSRYLVFGPPPDGIDVNVPGRVEDQVIVDWRSQHPVLQYVNLTNLFVAKAHQMELPRSATVLAEFNGSPAIALLRREGVPYLLAGFNILESNWPFEPSFVLFCFNALNYLGSQAAGGETHELAVGEPIAIEGIADNAVVTITRPDASRVELKPAPGGTVRFPGTHRAGVYAAAVPGRPQRYYAVNLLDGDESRIEPEDSIEFATVTVAAEEQAIQRANVPLWPALVLAALGLVCLEWLAYNSRVRL